jgi:membrane protein required for colicin V production
VRGFVFEVMSLVGWLVAWFAAQWLAAEAAPHLPIGRQARRSTWQRPSPLASWRLIVWALLAKLVRCC